MNLRHTIGSAIREARILEGITREELAERLNGWTPAYIRDVEDGIVNLTIDGAEYILSNLKHGECYKFVKVNAADYWKRRCELAEKYIYESHSDTYITKHQQNAWSEYQNFINTTHHES